MREDPGGKAPIENQDDGEFTLDRLINGMVRELEYCREVFAGFDYIVALDGSPTERVQTIKVAQDFLLQKNGWKGTVIDRFLDHATALMKAFALASATPQAQAIKREVAFFQTVKVAIAKTTGRGNAAKDERLDHAIRQLVDRAIVQDGVLDIFAAAGLEKPNIAVISDTFLDDVRTMPQKNLALEMLKKLLNDEITASRRTSIVQSRRFSEKLDESINRYHNGALEMAQIIEALSESAKVVMGDDQLLTIAREVAQTVRQNASIDWRQREQVQAKLRVMVRRVLNRHKYPPENRDEAVALIIQQAEMLVEETLR